MFCAAKTQHDPTTVRLVEQAPVEALSLLVRVPNPVTSFFLVTVLMKGCCLTFGSAVHSNIQYRELYKNPSGQTLGSTEALSLLEKAGLGYSGVVHLGPTE